MFKIAIILHVFCTVYNLFHNLCILFKCGTLYTFICVYFMFYFFMFHVCYQFYFFILCKVNIIFWTEFENSQINVSETQRTCGTSLPVRSCANYLGILKSVWLSKNIHLLYLFYFICELIACTKYNYSGVGLLTVCSLLIWTKTQRQLTI